MNIQELAKALGITVNAVRQRAYRGNVVITNGTIDDLSAHNLIHKRTERSCRRCKKTFAPQHTNEQYCSVNCKREHNNYGKKLRSKMHPLNSVHISGVKGEDRRIRFSDGDKDEIRHKHKNGQSITSLAKDYEVNKRAIQFVLFPERYEHAKMLAKMRRADGRYKPTKEHHRVVMADHRKHKRMILKGKGILP